MNSIDVIMTEIREGLESGEFTGQELMSMVRVMICEIEAELEEKNEDN